MRVCNPWLPRALRRPLSPESLIELVGSAGWRSLSLPTRLCQTWHWLRRLHRAMAITNNTSVKAVLSRTRRTLVDHGSLSCTQRSITSLGYTSLNIVMLTCSHTLSSTSISRNLYIESSLGVSFSFLVVCQIWSFLVLSFPL